MNKQIGYIGLGKMGKNMVFRLLAHGWKVVAYNRTPDVLAEVEEKGGKGVASIKELGEKIEGTRIIFMMVTHTAVDEILKELVPILHKGDIVIDGGNSPYLDTMRRANELEEKGIEFMDIGVSGGPAGALSGACMMLGGKKENFDFIEKLGFFADTCLPEGYGYMGPHGAGHFVKMTHNGIEYGMMQAIAEGFDLLRHTKEFGKDFSLDLLKIAEVYSHGSVITSSLVSWMEDGYRKYGKDLNDISGKASATGEGKWTVEAGFKENIKMPVIEASLKVRADSQIKPSYQGKVVSTMRGEFGQHMVERGDDEPEIL